MILPRGTLGKGAYGDGRQMNPYEKLLLVLFCGIILVTFAGFTFKKAQYFKDLYQSP